MTTPFRSDRALALALAVVVGACSAAESSDAPDTERPAVEETTPAVPSGTEMAFRTDERVSTDDNAAGDVFTATLTADVTDDDGSLLLPAGTESRWEVTRATNDDGEGNAVLAFRLASVYTGAGWEPANATVVSTDLTVDEKDSDKETAAKVAIGGAAGALVGQILGKDTESTLKGAAAGTAMGTVVALSTRGGSARLEPGSTIRVRLDGPLQLK